MDFTANWVGVITDKEAGKGTKTMENGSPAAYLRREFFVKKNVENAQLTISALGLYLCYINGEATDDELFKPQWSDYNKTIDYKTFDVTSKIHQGENCVGAILGDGWYCGKLSIIGRQLYGTYPLELFLQLDITYSDGEKERIVSDSSFKGGTGSIRDNDFQNGENIDNRINTDNFSVVGFDDSAWNFATIQENKSNRLTESKAPPIKYHEKFVAKFLHNDKRGRMIFDIGQNLAGNISAIINGNYGDKVIFRYGEMLDLGGELYTENLRSAKSTDTYICRGVQNEVFAPNFTFHGFRYVEIDSPSTCVVSNIIAKAIYSDLKETGAFSCDSELVNKIFKNAFWGQKSNFVGLPTDCPQRDERMGWTGDCFAFCGSAMYNMDCRSFYLKYMRDLVACQCVDGAVTDVVPFVPIVGMGNNGWGDVITELPYTYYLMYGDKEFLKEFLPNMKKWVRYQEQHSSNLIRPYAGYGDWLSIVYNEAAVDAMNTAMFAHSAFLVSEICGILQDNEQADYINLFERIKQRYIETFVKKDGTIANNSQGDYLFAAAYNLVPLNDIKDNLIKALEKTDNHLSCGFMSIKYLLPILCEIGRSDLAFKLITCDTFPSWGYSIKQGATTIWERWNSFTTSEGFGSVEMNSFNHYCFGSCVEWIYRFMLGINYSKDSAGFSAITIKPYIDFSGKINHASGNYNSINGNIFVEWKVLGNDFTINIICDKKIKLDVDLSDYEITNTNKIDTTTVIFGKKKA